MTFSIKVITSFNQILEIETAWNNDLITTVQNPLFYSRVFEGFMRYWEAKGWTPLVFTFWDDTRLVGFVPLKMRKSLYSNHVCNLDEAVFSNFVFLNEYRERCLSGLVDTLFNSLGCRSATITLDSASENLQLLEKICKTNKLHFRENPNISRAIILVDQSWDMFYSSLTRSTKQGFKRIKKQLDRLGPWTISFMDLNSDTVKKIFDIEQASWKNEWRSKNKVTEDYTLRSVLDASLPCDGVTPIFEPKVWFLEVDGQAIAYLLVLFYKQIAVFAKTSFNISFKKYSPGKFLLHSAIREVFTKNGVKKIDFITNLPLVRLWNPLSEHRTNVKIEKHRFLSYVLSVLLKNPISRRILKSP